MTENTYGELLYRDHEYEVWEVFDCTGNRSWAELNGARLDPDAENIKAWSDIGRRIVRDFMDSGTSMDLTVKSHD